MDPSAIMVSATRAALRAGAAILDVYRGEIEVALKADQSPLTLADTRAHGIIVAHLQRAGIPILSEEGKHLPHAERRRWGRLWIVDPLDGTKEFIKRLGEFTVNIALVEAGRPVLGVVFVPVKNVLYFGALETGAFRLEDPAALEALAGSEAGDDDAKLLDRAQRASRRLPVDTEPHRPFVIVGSRSHATPELHEFVARKREELGEVEFISAGSSLKYCLVAEGRADVYPRLGPTMEWDTAAGQVIAEAAGASVARWDTGVPMTYNKADLLNPWHIVTRKPPVPGGGREG
jgi:3'(2'), 5'-bisphosphate nucleotidase